MVTGAIQPERVREVADPYRKGILDGLPPSIEETFLLQSDPGKLAILSVWHRRADLDAMLASGEEPFARRLIREAGGTPEATFFRIVARSGE